LLDQPYIKDPSITVGDLIKQTIARVGENIRVRRFTRYRLGEELATPAPASPVPEVTAANAQPEPAADAPQASRSRSKKE